MISIEKKNVCWNRGDNLYVVGLKKSGQDKEALAVTVPPYIMHLHVIIFILEPKKLLYAKKWWV